MPSASTRHIKVTIGTAEQRIKGDIPRKKVEVVWSRRQGTRRDGNTPALNNVLSLVSSEKKSDAPDQGALMQREYGMRSEISTLNCL